MKTNTTLLVTGIILVVVAATMAIRVESVYAVTAGSLAPGQEAKSEDTSAKSEAPGQQAAQTGLPASQFAPGIEKTVTAPGPCPGC